MASVEMGLSWGSETVVKGQYILWQGRMLGHHGQPLPMAPTARHYMGATTSSRRSNSETAEAAVWDGNIRAWAGARRRHWVG